MPPVDYKHSGERRIARDSVFKSETKKETDALR
jgi:hypothetical protein